MSQRKRSIRLQSLRATLSVLLTLLMLPVQDLLVQVAKAQSPASVTLVPTTAPNAAEPGVTVVNATGSGFPAGNISAANVKVTLAPASAGPALTATALSTMNIGGSSRRIAFQVAPNSQILAPTVYRVSVSGTTSTGASFASTNTSALTVNPAATIALTPASGNPGQSISVAITGRFSNFIAGSAVASFGPGISVGGAAQGANGPVTVISSTSAKVQIQIAASVPSGPVTAIVTTGSERATAVFTINSPTIAPAITQNPTNLTVVTGSTATFTAAASGMPTPTVQWQVSTDGGTTFTNVTGATSTTLSFTTALTQTGNRYRAVFTNYVSSATTTAATLTVTGIAALTSISPNSAQQGQQSVAVTISGAYTHFAQGSSAANFGAGITVASLTVNSPTTATAVLNIDTSAVTGSRNVTITTGTEVVTLTNGFTVTAGTPVLTQANPSTGQQGQQNLSVVITGQFTHFVQGTTTASFGAGTTVVSLAVNSQVSATAVLNIDPAAVTGSRNVVVTTGSEAETLTNGFAVAPGTPVLLSAYPSSGQQGQNSLSVALTGGYTNWVQGTTTASFGAGITVASLTVSSATTASAVLNINPAATLGARTITTTTGPEVESFNSGFTVRGGQLTLSVQPPVSPTFQSSQVISGSVANEIGQTAVTIAGGSSGVSQNLSASQSQFGVNVPLKPNAENLLNVTAKDASGQTATAGNLKIVQLTLSNLVKAQVTAQRLTAPQIQALVANGTINLSNPANFNVSMFNVSLTIGGIRRASLSVPLIEGQGGGGQLLSIGPEIPVKCESPDQEIQENGNTLLIPCDGGGLVPWNVGFVKQLILRPFDLGIPGTTGSVPGILLIEGNIKTLKEFFNVDLILMNESSGFTLTNVSAMINVPDNGLSPVAPASGAITMADLAPTSQGTGQFVIRGDVIGVHTVTVNFGALVGGPLLTTPVPISGSASADVEVDGPPPLNVTVEQPVSVIAGTPYTLKVNIQNTSTVLDALYTSLELDLAGAILVDPTTGQPVQGPSIVSLGNILAGQTVSQSYSVLPSQTGPITSCLGGGSQNITLTVVFTNSGLGCAVGSLPSQVVSASGQPTVTVLPAPNTVNVPVVSRIAAYFSDAIQTQTITTGAPGATFLLKDSTGSLVPGQLQFSILSNGATAATFQPNSPLTPNSIYTVTIGSSIFDTNGAQLASGITENFTTEPPPPVDTTPPQVTIQILPPADATSIPQGQMLHVLVNSSDNSGTVARVDLLLDGQLADSRVPLGPVIFLVDTSALTPGSSHVLTAVATDPSSNAAQSSVNFAMAPDTTPPTVSISAPATVLAGQILPVLIAATDNVRVARVDLLLDGGATPIYTGFIAPYQVSLDTTQMSNGVHQLVAIAADGAGNVAQATQAFLVRSIASIVLSPGAITLNGTGSTQSLTVTATLTDATTIPVLSGVAFSSSSTTVAVVDSSGIVTSVAPGTATITATFGSLPPAQATVTDVASAPATLALASGNNQTGIVGLQLAAPLVVKATDASNRPVPNVAVTFSVLAGGGMVAQTTVLTDSQGLGSTTLALGQTPGANSATATAGTLAGSPVTFVATGILPTPGLSPTATSELFNLNNLNWSPLGPMSIPRAGTTLTVLGDRTVLVIGGVNTAANMFSSVVSGEVFTPATGTWTPTTSLTAPRAFHTTTLLPNGDVLITGGLDASGNPVATADVYRGPPVQKTTPVITWPTPAAITHATPLGGPQLNATANVPGTFVYGPPAGTILAVGSQKLTVTFTPTDTIHYTIATATVTLTVTP